MSETPARAAWLGGDLLLLSGSFGKKEVGASLGEEQVKVVARSLPLSSNGAEADRTALVVLRFREPVGHKASELTLTIGKGRSAKSVDAVELSGWLTEPHALLSRDLAPRHAETRAEALHFLWKAIAPSLDRPGSFPLAELLTSLHEQLRAPLPSMVFTRDHPSAANIDMAIKLGARGVWVRGWLQDSEAAVKRLTLVAPEGGRAELASDLFRFRRDDTSRTFATKKGPHPGFMRYAELDGASHYSSGWLLELETSFAGAVQCEVPELIRDLPGARDTLLLSMREEGPGSHELTREHIHPAMTVIQDELRDGAEIETVMQLGAEPSDPTVSVIVPLYRVLSFLEDQMAHWDGDPEMAQQDLIYVLDSPEQAAALEEMAHGLFSLYRIPFRVVFMRRNTGFANANNCAAQLARGSKLLLLNSDVVPDTPGWLGRMAAFYDATPKIGALGPKLMYEDDSIQHAGLYFYRTAGSSLWENLHYFKGQHRALPVANVARQVPGVTGACLMVDRGLYESIGGLSHRYVTGGYEDSDFCLRLIEEGREQWYMPGAELYHLEDQSYPRELRKRATRYNMWLHTELWGDRIQRLWDESER